MRRAGRDDSLPGSRKSSIRELEVEERENLVLCTSQSVLSVVCVNACVLYLHKLVSFFISFFFLLLLLSLVVVGGCARPPLSLFSLTLSAPGMLAGERREIEKKASMNE